MPEILPALRGRMGDRVFYATLMKLGRIATDVISTDDIHPNKELDALIQRAIGDRVQKEMVPYLVNEQQRFYGALVVAVYGGAPEFSKVNIAEHELLNDTDTTTYGFGLLRFDGSQIYYALDGQHRLKSIQEAVQLKPELRNDEITVIVLKHENSTEGMERTRRLFATLNRRAKPTTSGMNIALDEDDSVAIVTRRLVKENDTLKKLVAANVESLNVKQLAPSKKNNSYITTLAALYETNEILLGAYDGGLDINSQFKQFRRSYEDLDHYYHFLEDIWMRLLLQAPGFSKVLSGQRTPYDLRCKTNDNGVVALDDNDKPIPGGSVLARPVGHFVIAEVLRVVGLQGASIPDAIDALMENVPMDVDTVPWAQVIWNPNTRRIIGSKSDRMLIANILCHALGLRIGKKVTDLKQEYLDTTGNKRASLLPPITWSHAATESDESEGIEPPQSDLSE